MLTFLLRHYCVFQYNASNRLFAVLAFRTSFIIDKRWRLRDRCLQTAPKSATSHPSEGLLTRKTARQNNCSPEGPLAFRCLSRVKPGSAAKTNTRKSVRTAQNSDLTASWRSRSRGSASCLPHRGSNKKEGPQNGSLPIHRVDNVTLSASRTADAYEPSSGRTSCAQPYGSRA